MIRIKKILVPVDFSDASGKAANYGLSFALEFNSRLILAHIAPFDTTAYEQAKVDLLALIPPDCRERLDFEIVVKSGDVRPELLGIVGDEDVDLVVMGTRGRSYFERMILGSVTERLLRKLNVPILTVSHLDADRVVYQSGPIPLRRLLYATDLRDGSEEGLELLVRLARGLDASLTVVHVVRIADAVFNGMETAGVLPGFANEVRAQAEERLNRMVGVVSKGSVPISTVVEGGVPYETINHLAAQYKTDLIVINLQDKGRLERAVLGTTAERVIRTATVPVLSMPLPAGYASRWVAA
jgi:nucleotide-binding universal stress UspA family protein